jgi:hypothetical protein
MRLRTAVAIACGAIRTRDEVEGDAHLLDWKTLLFVQQYFRKLNTPRLCASVHDGTVYPTIDNYVSSRSPCS